MQNKFSVADHWEGAFDESALQTWAERLREQLAPLQPSLGLVFMSPDYFEQAEDIQEILRVHARIPLLMGCSSQSLIAGQTEREDSSGLVLGLYHLPKAELQAIHFTQAQVEACENPQDWHKETGIPPENSNGWLVFADPFHLNSEAWLEGWNKAYEPLPILGGLASGDAETQTTQVYLNGQVYQEGGVALSVGGEIELSSVISQGCTPIGETWTITKADQNLIYEIANRPAYQVLEETFQELNSDEQEMARGNLFIGIVTNEYLEEFRRGDFLIRNLIGADPKTGALAVGAFPRTGQTVQFQRRDAAASTEDMIHLLEDAGDQFEGRLLYGGCLCSCNGRGHRLFGSPDHDARQVQQHLGPMGLSGFFCNGEIGPVGQRNFLHGYTASLALFVQRAHA
jgi:small ligand-binding sensory domain FIST